MLFPIVALSLIALPFTASAARSVAVTLVFIAFYLSGMNARVIIMRLSQRDNVSLWVYLSVALGISGLLILAGVAFGAFAIDREDPAVGLALISLISLFILALNPILSSFLERSGKGDTPSVMRALPMIPRHTPRRWVRPSRAHKSLRMLPHRRIRT